MRRHLAREQWRDDWVSEPNLSDSPEKAAARKRLHNRRGFQRQIVGIVVLNAVLVAIWATSSRGYFWPGWVMAISVVVLILRFWDNSRRPISEADVDAAVERDRHNRAAWVLQSVYTEGSTSGTTRSWLWPTSAPCGGP